MSRLTSSSLAVSGGPVEAADLFGEGFAERGFRVEAEEFGGRAVEIDDAPPARR